MIEIVEALRAKRRASLIVAPEWLQEITCKCAQQMMDTDASASSYILGHLIIPISNTHPIPQLNMVQVVLVRCRPQ